jgi:hypothetical protein
MTAGQNRRWPVRAAAVVAGARLRVHANVGKATCLILAAVVVLLAACSSAPETAPLEAVPLPRPRPATTFRAPQPKPPRDNDTDAADVDWRNSDVVRSWALCKRLSAEAMARRTDQPLDAILAATATACASQEEQVRSWLAQRRMRPAEIAETMAAIRVADREQLADRILAVRRGR